MIPAGTRHVRPLLTGLLVAAIGCAALVMGVPEAGAQTCGPAPSGQIAVVMVVDNGSDAPSVVCTIVPERTTGFEALRAAGHQLDIDAGFLCKVDGFPASVCGNRPSANGAYWRYFHAAPGGTWSYSTVGGGGYRLPARCAVEGWRWSDAPAADITPRVAPPPVTCEAPAPAPTVAPTTPPAPSPAPTAAPESPSSGSPTPGVLPPPPSPEPGGQGTAPAVPPTTAVGTPDTSSPEQTTSSVAEVPSEVLPATEERDDADQVDGAEAASAEDEIAADSIGGDRSGASSSAWGLILGLVLVVVIVAASLVRARARAGAGGAAPEMNSPGDAEGP